MKQPTFFYFGHVIKGLYLIELDSFKDERGCNFEIYNRKLGTKGFQLDSCSISHYGSLRGFHGNKRGSKLIQCLFGTIQFYAIDMRENSPTYLNTQGFILRHDNPQQIYIPQGVVNAHLCLTKNCVFYYKWSDGYVPRNEQIHVKWNDPRFKNKIHWKIDKPILSQRDT